MAAIGAMGLAILHGLSLDDYPGAAGARHHQAAGLMMAGARRPYKVLGVK